MNVDTLLYELLSEAIDRGFPNATERRADSIARDAAVILAGLDAGSDNSWHTANRTQALETARAIHAEVTRQEEEA